MRHICASKCVTLCLKVWHLWHIYYIKLRHIKISASLWHTCGKPLFWRAILPVLNKEQFMGIYRDMKLKIKWKINNYVGWNWDMKGGISTKKYRYWGGWTNRYWDGWTDTSLLPLLIMEIWSQGVDVSWNFCYQLLYEIELKIYLTFQKNISMVIEHVPNINLDLKKCPT